MFDASKLLSNEELAFVDEYIQSIHLDDFGNISFEKLIRKISKFCGKEHAKKIEDTVLQRGDNAGISEENIYDLMNINLDTSIAFVGMFDGTFLKGIFSLILYYKDYFGKKIIDYGCNNGIITCFIAKAFPESTVLGVDLSELAVNNAKILAERLGLANVMFAQGDMFDIKEKGNTVFASKVVTEIARWEESDDYLSSNEQIKVFTQRFNKFGRLYAKNLLKDGYVVTVERMPNDESRLALMYAMNNNKLLPIAEMYFDFLFFSTCGYEQMPAFVCKKSAYSKSDAEIKSLAFNAN